MKTTLFTQELIKTLSPLEKEVIGILEKEKKYGAASIYAILSKKMKVAQSSISVVLDRLYKKGLLRRETETARGGMRFLYSLEKDSNRFEQKVVENTVNALIKKFGENAVAYFNESFNTPKKRKK